MAGDPSLQSAATVASSLSPSSSAAIQSRPSRASSTNNKAPAASKKPQSATSRAKKQSSSSPKSPSKVPSQKPPANPVAQYKKQCASYKYKDIARNPNSYKGKPAKFKGQVFQIQEAWGYDVILLQVTKGEYGVWNDSIYIEYTPKSDNESRILQNDIITVYGELNGIKTYTTIWGSSASVPYLKAQYVDISQASKE
jgi:hypothetical protein